MKVDFKEVIKRPFICFDAGLRKRCERLPPKLRLRLIVGLCLAFALVFVVNIAGALTDIHSPQKSALSVEHIKTLDLKPQRDSTNINKLMEYGRENE